MSHVMLSHVWTKNPVLGFNSSNVAGDSCSNLSNPAAHAYSTVLNAFIVQSIFYFLKKETSS